jgi:hypothetical protein
VGGGEYVKKSFVFLLATCLFAIVPSVTHAQSLLLKPVNAINQLGVPNLLSNATTETHTKDAVLEETPQSETVVSSDDEVQTDEVTVPENPLLAVNLLGVNLNLLGQEPIQIGLQSSEGTINSDSLLDLGLKLPAVGNINLDLLSNVNQTDSDGDLSSNSDLLGLGINDSLLLGNLNLDVLPQTQDTQGNESKALATIDVNNMFGDTSFGVIEENTNVTGEVKTVSSGLVDVDTKDSLAGDAHIGVGEITKTETPDSTETDAGLINVGIDNPITGDTQIAVLDSQQTETSDGKTVSGGLVIVDTNDSPVGDAHVGVGEVTKTETSDSTETDAGLIHIGVDNPVTGETNIDVLDSQQKETEDGTTVSVGVVDVDTKDSPIGDTHIGVGEINPGGTTEPVDTNKPADPTTPEEQAAPTESTPTEVTTQPTETTTPVKENPTSQETNPVVETPVSNDMTSTKETESSAIDSNTEDNNQIENSADLQNAGIELIAEVLPITGKIESNIESEKNDAAAELKKDLDAAGNDTENSPVQITTAAGPSTSSGSAGSGSGTGGSSSSGGGFAMSMYLGNEYEKEIDLENQVQSILKELSDEWIKAPPIKPPTAAFFLNI